MIFHQWPSLCHFSGPSNTLDIPRLPDPSTIYPPSVPHRRKAPVPPKPDPDPVCLISPLERPKTLEFAPRPRPTPARVRPWKLGSLSQTLSSSPGSSCDSPLGSGDGSAGAVRPNLMDMDVEGQSSDHTVPLCGQRQQGALCGQQFLLWKKQRERF